jgi:hypothetical protein
VVVLRRGATAANQQIPSHFEAFWLETGAADLIKQIEACIIYTGQH